MEASRQTGLPVDAEVMDERAAEGGARCGRPHAPGRGPQRAQLLAPALDRPRGREARHGGAAQAQHPHGDPERVHLGRRVHRRIRQPQRHPVPPRHVPDPRRVPQPSRREHHPASQGEDLGPRRRRPLAFGGQGLVRARVRPRRRRLRGGRPLHRGPRRPEPRDWRRPEAGADAAGPRRHDRAGQAGLGPQAQRRWPARGPGPGAPTPAP